MTQREAIRGRRAAITCHDVSGCRMQRPTSSVSQTGAAAGRREVATMRRPWLGVDSDPVSGCGSGVRKSS